MSASSLHRHFRAATSMTPQQYQKQIRLQEARALLLASARDVAQVGHLVGYESASQFSREYRRLFGAPPRADRDSERTQAHLRRFRSGADVDFEIPAELAAYLAELDEFIELQIRPLEQQGDNVRFFDHRRRRAHRLGPRRPANREWESLLAEMVRRADAAGHYRYAFPAEYGGSDGAVGPGLPG